MERSIHMTKSVEIDLNNAPRFPDAFAKLTEAAAQAIRLTPKPNDKKESA